MGGRRRQAAAIFIFAMLLAPALALIMTTQGGVVEASPDTFGHTEYDNGGDEWQVIEDRITGSWFTAPGSGTVTSISAYVFDPEGPEAYKYAIYDNADTLVGETGEGFAPGGGGWKTINISSGGSITSGVTYWLVVWGEGGMNKIAYDNEASKGEYDAEVYDGWPQGITPTPEGRKYAIYATYTPPAGVLPTQPVLSSPENDTYIFDNTPTLHWENAENAENHRLLVWYFDNSTVVENSELIDNTFTFTSVLVPDNYEWQVIAQSENGDNGSEVWQFEVYLQPYVTTGSATDITWNSATLHSTIDYNNVGSVEARFSYSENGSQWFAWSLSDHTYSAPTDPATAGDWGNRTPITYVAASDSSAADNARASYHCDGSADDNQINEAIENIYGLGGGTVFLSAGTYYIYGEVFEENTIYLNRGGITLLGAGRNSTFIEREVEEAFPVALISIAASNILVENLTVRGRGRWVDALERTGIHPLSGENIVINNCVIEDFVSIGIYCEIKDVGAEFNNIWITNNVVRNTGNQGIAAAPKTGDGQIIENMYILNNTIESGGAGSPGHTGGGHGIFLGGNVAHSVVANNTIENVGQDGINIGVMYNEPAPENVLIQANRIFNCGTLVSGWGSACVTISGSGAQITNDITIKGNVFFDNVSDNKLIGVRFTPLVENCTTDNNRMGTPNPYAENTGTGHTYTNNLIGRVTSWESTASASYSRSLVNLSLGTEYTFRGEILFNGLMDNGAEDSFTTFSGPPPSRPVLYLPADGSTTADNTPYFEWTSGENIENHRFELDNDPGFSSPNENVEILSGYLTYTFYSLDSDGYIYVSGTDYGAVHDVDGGLVDNLSAFLRIGQTYTDPNYRVDRAFLFFDTSALESRTIISAHLDVFGEFNGSFTEFDITVQTGGENYPNRPLVTTDYDDSLYSGNGGSIHTMFDDFSTWDYNDIVLNATGRSWINITGTTSFCLRSSRDISKTSPFEGEYVTIYSTDMGGGYRPRLRVTVAENSYTVPNDNALLDDNYSWRVAAINENGENFSATWTFIVSTAANVGPNAPTSLLTEGETNPTQITDYSSPELSAICTDNDDGDILTHYWIHVDNDNDFGSLYWDSGLIDLADFAEGNRCSDISYGGTDPVRGENYYWRIKFHDDENGEGLWSTETAVFTVNQLPTIPTNYTDLGMNLTNHTPGITWTKGTDADGDAVTTWIDIWDYLPLPGELHNTGDENHTLGLVWTLEDGVTYYYHLRSDDGLENSAFTALGDREFRMNSLPSVSPSIDPSTPILSDDLVCDANGMDSEGDSLTFTYRWFENNSLIAGQVANTLDDSHTENGNRYKCEVTPFDGHEYGLHENSAEVTVRGANTAPTTTNPRTNGQVNPEDITTRRPTLSWTYSDADGDAQTHYEIEVGNENGGSNLWDTGAVSGSYTSDIYGGTVLENGNTYYWRVQTRDGRDWSGWVTGSFSTCFLPTPEPTEIENEGLYFFIPADEDATVYEANPDAQYGVDTRLYCGLMAGREYTYLKFDLTAMEGLDYKRIELSMVADNCANVPLVEVWRGTNDWSEPNITWNTRSLVIEQAAIMGWNNGDDLKLYKTYYADVTDTVEDVFNQGITEITFVLIPQGSPSGQEAIFLSREAGNFHTLEILYTPETPLIPAVAVAFVFTLSLLGIFTWLYVKIRDVKNFSTGAWAIACVFISLLAIIITWGIATAFL